MIEINIKGHADTQKQLKSFAKNYRFAVARALTWTGQDVKKLEVEEMKRAFDRPTAYTLNSLFLAPAKKANLQARVWVKDDRATSKAGTPANRYLMPQVKGGDRGQKRFERVLQYGGYLPSGWITAPGPGASRDAHGNISRGQIIQILSQLRIETTAGYSRSMARGSKGTAAQRKAGGRFFVIKPGGRAQAGVYQREFFGRGVTPVLFFAEAANYERRYEFDKVATDNIPKLFPEHLKKSLAEALKTAYTSDPQPDAPALF